MSTFMQDIHLPQTRHALKATKKERKIYNVRVGLLSMFLRVVHALLYFVCLGTPSISKTSYVWMFPHLKREEHLQDNIKNIAKVICVSSLRRAARRRRWSRETRRRCRPSWASPAASSSTGPSCSSCCCSSSSRALSSWRLPHPDSAAGSSWP